MATHPKTEYMCYNQTSDISTLDGTSLKLVDKFTYLESSISSTKKTITPRAPPKSIVMIQLYVYIYIRKQNQQ